MDEDSVRLMLDKLVKEPLTVANSTFKMRVTEVRQTGEENVFTVGIDGRILLPSMQLAKRKVSVPLQWTDDDNELKRILINMFFAYSVTSTYLSTWVCPKDKAIDAFGDIFDILADPIMQRKWGINAFLFFTYFNVYMECAKYKKDVRTIHKIAEMMNLVYPKGVYEDEKYIVICPRVGIYLTYDKSEEMVVDEVPKVVGRYVLFREMQEDGGLFG